MQFEEATQIARSVAGDITLLHRSLPREIPRLTRSAAVANWAWLRGKVKNVLTEESFLGLAAGLTSGTDAAVLLPALGGAWLQANAVMTSWWNRPRIVPHVGVGVSVGAAPDSWRVAIRARSEVDLQVPALAQVRNLPESELDVRITGIIRPQANLLSIPSSRKRPLVAGCSIGHYQLSVAGTLGAFVRHADGRLLMLSCNHVLVEGNRRSQDDRIVQPGLEDGGQSPHDAVGQLQEFIRLQLDDNLVDAAVAAIDDAVMPNDLGLPGIGLVHGYHPPTALRTLASQHARVRKVGRTTEVTCGTIKSVLRTLPVDYDGVIRWFGPVIEVQSTDVTQPFSQRGDSGSLVVDDDGVAVGLIFAGDEDVSYLNSIAEVCQVLHVSF
jgi:hypothetical protein